MKIKNPMSVEDRIDLALDMMNRAKELENRFGPAWYMHQWGKLTLKLTELRLEKVS